MKKNDKASYILALQRGDSQTKQDGSGGSRPVDVNSHRVTLRSRGPSSDA